MPPVDEVWIDGPAGRLEARAHGDAAGPPLLLCHPHPLGRGSMRTRVIYDLARGLADDGWRVLRFNYRGVGRSEGGSSDGSGETDDALAAHDWLEARAGRPCVVVGHSYGGGVAVRLAGQRPVRALALLGVPPRISNSVLAPVDEADRVRARVLVVAGDRDGFVTVDETRRLAAAFTPGADLKILPGVGHFLYPQETPAALKAVREWLGTLPAPG